MKIQVSFLQGQYYVWDAQDAIQLRQRDRIVGRFIGTLPQVPHQNTFLSLPILLLYEQVYVLMEMDKIELVSAPQSHLPPTSTQVNQYQHQKQDELLEYSRLWNAYALDMKEYKKGLRDKEPSPPLAPLLFPTSSITLPYFQPRSMPLPECTSRLDRIRLQVFKYFYSLGYYMTAASKFGGDYLMYRDDPFLCHSSFIVSVVESIHTRLSLLTLVTQNRLSSRVNKQHIICSWSQEMGLVSVGLEWYKE